MGDLTGSTFTIQTTSTDDIGTYTLAMAVSLDDGTGQELSASTEIELEILPCQVESLNIAQFSDSYSFTISDDAEELELGTIQTTEQPACLYEQTIEV